MPKKRIYKDRSTDTRPKTRNRVECNCTLHCNGSKWVDPRTFERHQQEIERFRTITSVPQSTSQFRSSMSSSVDVESSTSKRRRKQEEEEEEGQDSTNSSYSDSNESNQTDYQEPINIPTKRKRYPKFRQTELIPDDENLNNDSDDNDSSDDNGGGSDDNGGGSGDNDGLNDNGDDNEDLIITNLIQRMMIMVLAMMISQSNNLLLPILMILILNQMMNIPIRILNSMILGYYYGFLSIW